MKRKLLAWFLVCTMVLSLIPMDVRAEEGEITWEATAVEGTVLVAQGESATLKVAVENPDNVELNYQWYRIINDNNETEAIDGEIYEIYETDAVTGPAEYYCNVEQEDGQSFPVWFTVSVDSGLEVTAVEDDYTDVDEYGDAVVTVSYEDAATLEVDASVYEEEDEPTYQWYVMEETEDGYEKKAIEGATEAIFEIDEVTEDVDYYCVVTDAYGYSKEINFFVTIESEWTVEAENGEDSVRVPAGQKATLKVVIESGEGHTFEYQWYDEDYEAIDGATSDTFVTPEINAYTDYYCVVTDERGIDEEVWFDLDVAIDWSAGSGDKYITVPAGTSTTLKVTIESGEGHTFTYQWYDEDYEEIDGATTDTFVTPKIGTNTEYWCEVTDENDNSVEVRFDVSVEVNWDAGAANDQYKVYVGDNGTASLEVVIDQGEDYEFEYQWYQYSKEDEEGILLDGEDAASYTVEDIAEYTRYYCEITDEYGNTERVYFDVFVGAKWSASAKDGEVKAVELDATATLEVAIESDEDVALSYQWYKWNADIYDGDAIQGAEEESYTTDSISKRTTYYCEVSDEYGKTEDVFFNVLVNANWDAEAVGDTEISVARHDVVTLETLVNNEEGLPLTYSWWKSGVDADDQLIESAKGTSYTIEGVTEDSQYYFIVTDEYDNQYFIDFDVMIDEEKEHTHAYGDYKVTEEATCKEAGSEVRICAGCKEEDTRAIPPTGKHTYGDPKVTKEATCTVAGTKTKTCTICGNEEHAEVPATGTHTYGEWTVTKEATCDAAGEQERTCTVCKNKETSAIPAIGYVKGATFTKGSYNYQIKTQKGKKGTVVCVGATKDLKKVSIPKTVKAGGITFTVTEIGSSAFKGNAKLKSVTIGTNVTKIGKNAFSGCKKLNKITIKSTKLKSVGKNAIKGINKKATIKVPKSKLKKYKNLFKTKTGYKKSMKIKK